jgi:hypothetical protein
MTGRPWQTVRTGSWHGAGSVCMWRTSTVNVLLTPGLETVWVGRNSPPHRA